MQKNNFFKKSISIVTIVLIISIAAQMTTIPTTSAHTPTWEIPTYAYIETPMNPIGVGQNAYVYMWLDKTISGALMNGNDIRFHDYELKITAPNGDVTTKTWDVVQDTTSSQSYSFTPDQIGTYTFRLLHSLDKPTPGVVPMTETIICQAMQQEP